MSAVGNGRLQSSLKGLLGILIVGSLAGAEVDAAPPTNRSSQNNMAVTRRTNAPGEALGTVEEPPVQVLVRKESHPDSIVYHYLVVNGSAFPIVALNIGCDYFHGEPELSEAPRGWEADSTPPGSTTTPQGWRVRLIQTEENPLAQLEWRSLSEEHRIMGGGTLSGFAVVLPAEDHLYEDGHWVVYLSTAESFYAGSIWDDNVTTVPPSSLFAVAGLRVTPNPARGIVEIQFEMPVAGVATVELFDAMGRLVRTLPKRALPAGIAHATWDGRDTVGHRAASGTYFVRVTTASRQRFAKLVWMR